MLGRLQRAERELEVERHKRRHAEQQLAGSRSATRKLQLLIAKQRAEDAERRAEGA